MPAAPIVPATVAPIHTYAHASATHHTQLGATLVHWQLVRSARRRSVALEVSDAGLTIRAPTHTTLATIESFLHAKTHWVLDKLHQRQLRHSQQPHIHWAHGAQLPFLGGIMHLHLHPSAAPQGQLLHIAPQHSVLHIAADPLAAAPQVRALTAAWWLRHAREHFSQRLHHFAPQLAVRWTRLRIASPRTKWGSARSDGAIMLNSRLLHHRSEVLDYVVIHELAHLRHMDHSPRFWAVVASICPQWRTLRDELRQRPIPSWTLPGERTRPTPSHGHDEPDDLDI